MNPLERISSVDARQLLASSGRRAVDHLEADQSHTRGTVRHRLVNRRPAFVPGIVDMAKDVFETADHRLEAVAPDGDIWLGEVGDLTTLLIEETAGSELSTAVLYFSAEVLRLMALDAPGGPIGSVSIHPRFESVSVELGRSTELAAVGLARSILRRREYRPSDPASSPYQYRGELYWVGNTLAEERALAEYGLQPGAFGKRFDHDNAEQVDPSQEELRVLDLPTDLELLHSALTGSHVAPP